MLSDVTYGSISGHLRGARFRGTAQPALRALAGGAGGPCRNTPRHAETGEPIPQDLLDRLLARQTYDMGFQTVEYVASALVDLAFHEGAAPADPMAAAGRDAGAARHAARDPMRHATPHFAHVFAGDGYSSGYYSYMWSEVMDADAFAAFEEAGDAFDPGLAAEAGDAYPVGRRIAGCGRALHRLPWPHAGVEALLKGRGLDQVA
jgi:peptidyl-dipeptidase Dcp